MRLQDRTVFITGAGSGIGRATARRCAREGATVVVTDVDVEGGEETVDMVERQEAGEAVFHELDVTDAEAMESTVEAAAEAHGLDVMVNNAGIGQGNYAMEEVPLEVRDRVFEINGKGVWNGCRAAIPHLKDGSEEGAIINVASLAGVIGQPWSSAYAFTKGGVVKFTRTIAGELGRYGVRANAVCPGFTDTPLVRSGLESRDDPEAAREKLEQQYALKRIGEPEEIADAILFLASEEASFVTGHALVIDGGYSCG